MTEFGTNPGPQVYKSSTLTTKPCHNLIGFPIYLFQPPGFAGPFPEMPDPPEIPDELKNECKVT